MKQSNQQQVDRLLDEVIARALAEDIGDGDVTTDAIVPPDRPATAVWVAKQDGVICGLEVGLRVFRQLDAELEWHCNLADGERVVAGGELARFHGRCRALLTGERVALNLVQRMSGIATATRHMVDELDGFDTRLLDTRKTAPGLRLLDKRAVVAGGGVNHRHGLYDMAMIKDNHIVAAGGIAAAVRQVRDRHRGVAIVVEATTIEQVDQALAAGADRIMLDNMDIDAMLEAVRLIGGRAETEASGNINMERLREVAATGVDFISVGALTHSVAAFDISQGLELV